MASKKCKCGHIEIVHVDNDKHRLYGERYCYMPKCDCKDFQEVAAGPKQNVFPIEKVLA